MPDEKGQRAGGADPDGFVPVSTLRARARSTTLDEFVKTCPGPALLVLGDVSESGVTPAGGSERPSASGSGVLIVTLEGGSSNSSAAAKRFHARVAFIAKRPGNPFPNMISLGRSTSNDLTIALDTVSKLHGYFLRESDGWFYTDYQSTNGTAINDKRVAKGEKQLLVDGDRFRIGLDLIALFLTPASLYERLRGGGA